MYIYKKDKYTIFTKKNEQTLNKHLQGFAQLSRNQEMQKEGPREDGEEGIKGVPDVGRRRQQAARRREGEVDCVERLNPTTKNKN